jgi:hypothetical protein
MKLKLFKKDPIHNLAKDLLKVIKKGNESLPEGRKLYLKDNKICDLRQNLSFLQCRETGLFSVEIFLYHLKFGEWCCMQRFSLEYFNDVIKKDPKGFCEDISFKFDNALITQLYANNYSNRKHLGRLYKNRPSKPYIKNFSKFIGKLEDKEHLLVFNRKTFHNLRLAKNSSGDYYFKPFLGDSHNCGLSPSTFCNGRNQFHYLFSDRAPDHEISWISKHDFLNIPRLPVNYFSSLDRQMRKVNIAFAKLCREICRVLKIQTVAEYLNNKINKI